MITSSAATICVEAMSRFTTENKTCGEYFPAMEEAALAAQLAKSEARHNRFRASWKAVAGAPHRVIGLFARVVPASARAAWNARAEAKALEIEYRRLEELSPHLLADIGIAQMARGVYGALETDEPPAETLISEPTLAAVRPMPAAKPAPQPVRQPWAGHAPASFADVVPV